MADETSTVLLDNAYVILPERADGKSTVETISARVASADYTTQVMIDNAYVILPERADVKSSLETVSARVASKTVPTTQLSAVRTQVIQQAAGELAINKGVTGWTMFSTLFKSAMKIAVDLTRLTFTRPTQVAGRLSKVTVTAKELNPYRGSIDVTYNRYSINVLDNLLLPDGGFVNVAAFLAYVQGLGYSLLAEDIDNVKSVVNPDGTVKIYPHPDSYLFSPDGYYDSSAVIKIDVLLPVLETTDFDNTPKLHMAIANDTLNGFEIVVPLVLDDEIVTDTLNGFDAVGSN
jgi:hypothetical protein